MAPETPDVSARLRLAGNALYRAAGIHVEHHEDEVAGLPTHWVTAGSSESPHAVLLHGSGGSAALWYPALTALAERRHVIAVDMPGHGETKIPAWRSPGTMERMLDWLDAFLDMFEWPLSLAIRWAATWRWCILRAGDRTSPGWFWSTPPASGRDRRAS